MGAPSDKNYAEEHILEDIDGLVAEATPESIRIESEAPEVIIEGRTLRYLSESGFLLEEKDLVELVGFRENGEYKILTIRNMTSEKIIQVRDETGRPFWSGGRSGS